MEYATKGLYLFIFFFGNTLQPNALSESNCLGAANGASGNKSGGTLIKKWRTH